MNSQYKYVLDANIFIQAHQTYYAFDLVPSFWENLILNAENNKIISIDKIKEELSNSNDDDELSKWVSVYFHQWFMSCANEKVYNCYSEIMEWSQNNEQFLPEAKEEFARSADAWIIAYAKAHNHIVVTHETYDANIRKRIKIPNVCETFGISYIDTFSMLRELKIQIG